jgi:hypothetical protein
MKRASIVALLAACLGSPASAQSEACQVFDGALVFNSDDEFIGRIANSYASDSIFNEFGQYGSQFRSESIWNQFGKNGSEFQANSAFNQFTSNPPKIIKDRQVIGYLTVNRSIRGGVSPVLLGALCYDFEPPR